MRTPHRTALRLLPVSLCVLTATGAAGCYSHVVRAEGTQKARYDTIHEPNLPDRKGPIEALILGDDDPGRTRRDRR